MKDKSQKQHPMLTQLVKDAKAGKIDRREFISTASIFGATAAFSYGVLGQAAPARADGRGKKGGILKIGMRSGHSARTVRRHSLEVDAFGNTQSIFHALSTSRCRRR